MMKRSWCYLLNAILALLLVAPDVAVAQIAGDQLRSQGYLDTRICPLDVRHLGVGKLSSVQFKRQSSREADQQEIEALLGILSETVLDSGQTYIAFSSLRDWQRCRDGTRRELFWYGPDREWVSVGQNPLKYLRRLSRELPPDWQDSPEEAYVLFALGRIELEKRRIDTGMQKLRRAADILMSKGDPMNLQPAVLRPLVRYYLSDGNDVSLGQNYLNAYALAVADRESFDPEETPLVRYAAIYPRAALVQGVEGYVILEFRVSSEGRVENAVVIEESPKGVFSEAALVAASHFLYTPKVVDGERVAVEGVRNRITFQIE